MAKMKTHRGAAKRFKLTGSGKIARVKAFHSHILEKKTAKRKRNLGRPTTVSGSDERSIKRLLGK